MSGAIGHYFLESTWKDALDYMYAEIEGSSYTALSSADASWDSNGVILRFDQTEFIDYTGEGSSGMRDSGWMYYPNSCIGAECKLVFMFHGGGMFGATLMDPELAIASVAAANNLIVVFPQGDVRGATNCWDVSDGYTGDDFDTKTGVQ